MAMNTIDLDLSGRLLAIGRIVDTRVGSWAGIYLLHVKDAEAHWNTVSKRQSTGWFFYCDHTVMEKSPGSLFLSVILLTAQWHKTRLLGAHILHQQ